MIKNEISFEDFLRLDIRTGRIERVEVFEKALKPAYKVWVDFGDKIGVLKTSAQVTECYQPIDLIGMNVLGLLNLPSKQIADFKSEFLMLGLYTAEGVVLVSPNKNAKPGDILG